MYEYDLKEAKAKLRDVDAEHHKEKELRKMFESQASSDEQKEKFSKQALCKTKYGSITSISRRTLLVRILKGDL